jgi:hypothetical protein
VFNALFVTDIDVLPTDAFAVNEVYELTVEFGFATVNVPSFPLCADEKTATIEVNNTSSVALVTRIV